MPRKKTNPMDDNGVHVAEEEYKYAITLMQYATQLLSQQFGVFMVAETVILGFLGNALRVNNELVLDENNWVFSGALIGLVICVFWWSTLVYNHKFYLLRMAQAKRHEANLGFRLFTEGKELSEGKKVKIDGDEITNKLFKWLQPYPAMRLLIALFSGIFIFLIIFTRPR